MVGVTLLHDSALINIVSLEECISEFTEIKKAIVSFQQYRPEMGVYCHSPNPMY